MDYTYLFYGVILGLQLVHHCLHLASSLMMDATLSGLCCWFSDTRNVSLSPIPVCIHAVHPIPSYTIPLSRFVIFLFPSFIPPSPCLSVSDVVVDSTVEQLLETVSTHSTEDHCIAHLASLSGVSLPSELSASTTLKDNSRDYDHAHVHRATA